MIDRIIHYSLHHRVSLLVGMLIVIVGGLYSVKNMDIDVFPDLTAPQVVVMTDCRGMAAEETERLVTFPIETALNGASHVRRVRSSSYFGFSYVWAEFDWGMDVYRARQIVSENMITISDQLPEGITPQLAPQSSVMGEILFVGLQVDPSQVKSATADTTSMMELRSLADWLIKPAILATGGVSSVVAIGGDVKQYQVLADPMRMDAYGVSMEELEATVRAMSENSEGGVIRDYGNEYALRGIGRTTDIQLMASNPIKTERVRDMSGVVCVGDVADVVVAPALPMGTGSLRGKPAVILSISKQPNINTLDVTRKIEASLEDIRHSLPSDVVMDTHIFRQADFIEASVQNVGRALIEGAILCIIILFLFLGSIRTTVISVVAIPLSLLATLIVLYLLGMEINTMTLGGMCIAIGSLVDDAIIDVENVYKRLRQRYAEGAAGGVWEATKVVFEASKEIRSSILNATLIVIVAFTPMFFLSGMEGRMLKPLGITYIIALAMSLIVAMTVTPLFCRMLLTSPRYLERQTSHQRRFVDVMQCAYGHSLRWVMKHPYSVLTVTIVALVGSVVMLFSFGSSFLPDFNEGAFTIQAVCPPGVSLEETDRVGHLLEEKLLQIPEVATTSRRTGRGEMSEHSQGTNAMEIDVNYTLGGRDKQQIEHDVRRAISGVPGVTCIVGQPLGHRIDHMISGTRASIAIKLFGSDLSQMYMTAQRIQHAIGGVEGLVDVSIDQQMETPQLHLRPRRQAMARYGITMAEFNQMVAFAFNGQKVGDIYEGQRAFDLVLRLSPQYTGGLDGVRKALMDTHVEVKEGEEGCNKVPLEEICDIVSTSGPGSVNRENVQRKLVIAANVSGRDVGSAVKDIQRLVSQKVKLPEGYRLEYGGQFESATSAMQTLVLATIAALLVIFMLLYSEFRRFSLASLVMCGLPLALIGGVMGVALSSWVISIPSIIGFITLFGIATRNSILLISHYQHTPIVEGSMDRLNPILMTALTSALALIPLILGSDKAGNEIQSPMAIVVLGGLITSTLLNLYVMPVIYDLYIKLTSHD